MPMIDTSVLVDGFFSPTESNPVAGQAEDQVVEWLWRVGFLTSPRQEAHLRSFELGLYHGIVTPRADVAAMVLGLKWFCWGSLADDQYDNYEGKDGERRFAEVVSDMRAVIAGQGISPSNPVVAGFADYWPDLTRCLDEVGRRRITVDYLGYLEAVALQNRYHARGEVPDEATFVPMRRRTVAMIFQVDVLEVVSAYRIPETLRDGAVFRELVRCFADVAAWHNDVYGVEKDVADGQTCNMVRVLAESTRCGLDEAAARVVERARHRQHVFLTCERQLPGLATELGLAPESAEQALGLARDLRAYLYANLIWCGRTRRYDLELPRTRGTFDDVLSG
ncbi:terpene synthase family protein [Pseudonocardia spinosispora]|uniref:terpene synthase family protein n=1 Tax=Pseudonocardia spinosispora TaxID=103441 RepID=UPI0004088CD4|nr:terpene synthase family protein [Pseudonocardia spinosispora]